MISIVDGLIYRGSRPEASEYDAIKKQFAQVISLEGAAEDEKEALALDPVRLFAFPISTWEIYVSGITQPQLQGILHAIQTARMPLLVHCEHGQDRTGLVIAAYRVVVNGWTKYAAWAEAKAFGYHGILNVGLNDTWAAFTGT